MKMRGVLLLSLVAVLRHDVLSANVLPRLRENPRRRVRGDRDNPFTRCLNAARRRCPPCGLLGPGKSGLDTALSRRDIHHSGCPDRRWRLGTLGDNRIFLWTGRANPIAAPIPEGWGHLSLPGGLSCLH